MILKTALFSASTTESPTRLCSLVSSVMCAMAVKFRCTCCNQKLSSFSCLKRHMKRLHPNEASPVLRKKLLDFQCNKCTSQFSKLHHLKHHLKKNHQISDHNVELVLCPFCQVQVNKIRILHHYENEHDVKLESERLTFKSYEEFKAWKNNMETYTSSRYIMQRSNKCKEKKALYFPCNRSGDYHPSVEIRKRALKSGGSWKINHICPAKLKVTLNCDGICSVLYVKTHVGHGTQEGLGHKIRKNFKHETHEDLRPISSTAEQTIPEENVDKLKDECLKKFQAILNKIETEKGLTYVMNQLDSLEYELAVLNIL